MLAFVFLLGGLLGGGSAYFFLRTPMLEAAHARVQEYQQELAALRGRLDQADKAGAAFEGRLLIEESTRRGLEASLKQLQQELGQARDSLAFYEQLMPPGPKGSISIRALDIEPLGPHLRYRVLLMRSGSSGKAFQGSLQFVATGLLNGEETSLSLLPIIVPLAEEQGAEPIQGAAGDDDAGKAAEAPAGSDAPLQRTDASQNDINDEFLEVEFTDFQRSSGLLALPAGFLPRSIAVNVLEGRKLRVSRSIDLPVPE